METCSPVGEIGVEVKEAIVGWIQGIVNEIKVYDAEIRKRPRLPIIVGAMVAYPCKIDLDAIIPRVFSCSIVLIKTPAKIYKIPCAIITRIGHSDISKADWKARDETTRSDHKRRLNLRTRYPG